MTTVAAPTGPDILSPAFDADPYPFYTEMREAYPLYHHEVSGFWMVSRYHDVERVFKDGESFSSRNYEWQNAAGPGGAGAVRRLPHADHHRTARRSRRGPALEDAAGNLRRHLHGGLGGAGVHEPAG